MRLKKKDRLYYARIIPKTRIFEVCEVFARTVEDTWFVAIDKRDKHAYLFIYDDIGKILFYERKIGVSSAVVGIVEKCITGCLLVFCFFSSE